MSHPDHHAGGIGQYLGVFLALCLLTGASFFTTSPYWPFKETDSIGWAFMMAVSCTKAMLVILFFMHLKWEANWKYVLTIPAAFMSVFLVCMMIPDIGLRTRTYSEERNIFAAEAIKYHKEVHDVGLGHEAGESDSDTGGSHGARSESEARHREAASGH